MLGAGLLILLSFSAGSGQAQTDNSPTPRPSFTPRPQELSLGWYGAWDDEGALGLALAVNQMAAEGSFEGADGRNYRFTMMASRDFADLAGSFAILTDDASFNAGEIPLIVLSSEAELGVGVWRGLTPQSILEDTLIDFLVNQGGIQRALFIGDNTQDESGRFEAWRGRLLLRGGVELQSRAETLITLEGFETLLQFNPQALFYAGDAVSALNLLSALAGRGWDGYFVYPDPAALYNAPDFNPPPNIRVLDVLPWLTLAGDDLGEAFSAAYQMAYEQSPSAESVAAYDLTWALRLMVGRVGGNSEVVQAALPTTNLIRTTQGQINPALYSEGDLFRNAVILLRGANGTAQNLARYDNRVLIALDTPEISLATATPFPSATPRLSVFSVTVQTLNIRNGPNRAFAVIGQATEGQNFTVLGKLADDTWYLVESIFGLGWVDAQFGTLFEAAPIPVLAMPPTPTPSPTLPPTQPPSSNNNGGFDPPPVANPNPNIGAPNPDFMFGGQVDNQAAALGAMQQANMSWIKQQVRWERGETPANGAAGAISGARERGMRILISSVGWTREMGEFDAYLAEYVDYLGQVAALGPDAIEIWNEPNLDREWPAGRIDGATYTGLLRAAYTTIKAANPNVLVISGAPAPTGFFGGCGAGGCDDDRFLRQMAAAGAANYLDCVGAHFNEGIISPSQRSGDPRGGHHSYYVLNQIDLYHGIFNGAKPICFTELGYLTGAGFGALPPGFEWAANTSLDQHAAWLGEAANLLRRDSRVRMMIVWNVDFGAFGADPRAAYAIIRPDGACVACSALAAATR